MNLRRLLWIVLVWVSGALRSIEASGAPGEWPAPGGDTSESHFSALEQINAENVSLLKLAWQFDVPDGVSLTSTPLMVGRTLYFSADRGIVHALDAATGARLWT